MDSFTGGKTGVPGAQEEMLLRGKRGVTRFIL
jgi:hypothetical protein